MKVEIEISEEDAACIWADNWNQGEIRVLIAEMAASRARAYRRSFPKSVPSVVQKFRALQNQQPAAPMPT